MEAFVHAGVHLMEFLFFFGLLGSLFVVLLSAVDDAHELFKSDEAS